METKPIITETLHPYNVDAMKPLTPTMDGMIYVTVSDIMDEYKEQYEPINDDAEFERIEFEGTGMRSEGGFRMLLLFPASEDTAHCPQIFQDYITKCLNNCAADFYKEQVGEEGTEQDVTVYMEKILGREDEDTDIYQEFELAYLAECTPALQVDIIYLGGENGQNPNHVPIGMRTMVGDRPWQNQPQVFMRVGINTDVQGYHPTSVRIIPDGEVYFDVTPDLPDRIGVQLKEYINKL